MKVLMLLSNYFLQDPRVLQEARSLKSNGHQITVIVWDKHYRYNSEESFEGINIIRLANTSVMRLLKKNLVRNPFWWYNAYKKAMALYKTNFKFDVVHCHDLDTLPTGVMLKNKLKIRLVYDAHEIFGHMISDLPRPIPYSAFKLEKILLKKVDQIITVNIPLKDYFSSISDKPIEIVMNCKKLIGKKYLPIHNKDFTICYFGVLSSTRMFPDIIDIIASIPGVRFLIASRKNRLYDQVENHCKKYDNVEFLGTLPLDQVITCTLGCDAVLCMINPLNKNQKNALAIKQFEAMICGRPLITSKDTYIGNFTEHFGCGIATEFTQGGIINAIKILRDNPDLCRDLGITALKEAINYFNWGEEEKNLIKIYGG